MHKPLCVIANGWEASFRQRSFMTSSHCLTTSPDMSPLLRILRCTALRWIVPPSKSCFDILISTTIRWKPSCIIDNASAHCAIGKTCVGMRLSPKRIGSDYSHIFHFKSFLTGPNLTFCAGLSLELAAVSPKSRRVLGISPTFFCISPRFHLISPSI